MNIFFVAVFALIINIFLGTRRARYRKLSLMWWILIHASIPLIIPLRIWLGTPGWAVPVFIAVAIAGQWIGSNSQVLIDKCKQQ